MAGKVRHLLERNGRFFARLAVPEALRPILGKRELLEALGGGRREALQALPLAIARMRVQVETARSESRAGKTARATRFRGRRLSVREMAQVHYADQLAFDEELRNSTHVFAHGFIDENYVARLKECISGAASNEDTKATVGWVVDKFKANGNADFEFGTPEWREAARALATAELESLRRTAERDEGDFSGKPLDPLLTDTPKIAPKDDPLIARAMSVESQNSLSDLLPLYMKERGAKARSDYDSAVTVRMLEEFLQEKRPLYRITRQDVNAFKRALGETPSNYTKRFGGLRLPEAIKANKARKTPYPNLNTKTINDKYLSKLHSILNWCVRNDLIPDNPATGIKVEAVKDKSTPSRIPFSPSDLTRLFSPEHFGSDKPLAEFEWAMLISLFSGMRASELAQIKLDSIRHERGILVFAVEEETKTSGSRRIVPVQKTLIELKLPSHIEKLRKNGAYHLFPDWHGKGLEDKARARANGSVTLNQYFPRFIPKRFNDTYMAKVGIQDSRKSWHSFRHTFKTGLARAGVPRPIQDDLCGHSVYSAGGVYILEISVEAMKEAIDKLHFDGLLDTSLKTTDGLT